MAPLTGAAGRGYWQRLEVECCSWEWGWGGGSSSCPGVSLHQVPVSKTKLLLLRARGGGLPQSWTERNTISFP